MKSIFAVLAAFSLLFLAYSQTVVTQPVQTVTVPVQQVPAGQTVQYVTVPAGTQPAPQVVYVQAPPQQQPDPQVVYVQAPPQQQPAPQVVYVQGPPPQQQPQTVVYQTQPEVQVVQPQAQAQVQAQPQAQSQPEVQAQAAPAQPAQPAQPEVQAQPEVPLGSSSTESGNGFDTSYKAPKGENDVPAEEAGKATEKNFGSVDTTKNFLDSELMDIKWCGEKKNIIFMLSETNTLYRSVDDGVSGHMMSSHLESLGKKELGGSNGKVGQPIRMIQHPTDKNTLVVLGNLGVNWITEDCGAAFRVLNKNKNFEDIKFHPTERNWALGTSWNTCGEHVINEACHVSRQLFVTKDLGNTWEKIIDFVYDFEWAKVDESYWFIPTERIIISHFAQAVGSQQISSWDPRLQVSFSDDLFKTHTNVLMGGNKFMLSSNYLFIVQAVNGTTEEVRLYVANPRAKDYIPKEVELPTGRLTSKSYTILDTSEHSVFIHIEQASSTHGHVYVSDSTGVRFSLALKNNARDWSGLCDFERVQGLEGIYLANVYDGDAIKNLQKRESDDSQGIPFQHGGSKKTSADAYQRGSTTDSRMRNTAEKTLDDYKKTMISFDKGSIWQTLTPPERNVFGKKIVCNSEETCGLHLHSTSSRRFGPIYTTANSLGIVLASGNVGEYLSNKPDEINTYLSRDGGLTWYEIANGSHIYDVGDHGGLIIIAPDQTGTKSIKYSWDEGMTWTEQIISDVEIEITNIITEPSNVGEKFVVYGREKGGKRGVVVALDFTSLHQRICVLPDKPDTPDSDYESFTPNGRISPHCLLGRQVTYVRRKREAQCFNNEERDNYLSIHQCECTEEDWICDFGYSRQGSGPCLPMDDKIKTQSMTIPEVCDSYYFVTQGYRKIGGDSCKGGINHEPLKLPCPGQGLTSSKNLLILLVLASAVIGFMYLNKNVNPDAVKAFWFRIREKIESLRNTRSSPSSRKDGYSNKLPASADDDDEEMFSNVVFDNDDTDEPEGEAISLVERNPAKKMTEGKAIDVADRPVPLLNKPKDKKEI